LSRINELISTNIIVPSEVKYLVLDDADILANDRFKYSLYELVSKLNPEFKCM
jgi:superfamily II DNA/RNA helicase